MAKRRKSKKIEKQIKNIKNPQGFDVKYLKVGVGSTDSYDAFDRIINSSGKWFLYDEMSKNEAVVAAWTNLIESSATSEEIFLKPSDDSEEAKQLKEYVEQMVFKDMETSFSDTIKDLLTMTKYGFSLAEIELKKRLGYHPENPKKNSRYNDGLIGIRRFAPRHQKTICDWEYDKYSRISGVTQEDPNNYTSKATIPYSSVLHCKIKSYNGNPWGVSALRACAMSYYNKKIILREQKQRYERGFVGVPEVTYPYVWADPNNPNNSLIDEFITSMKNLRMGEDAAIVRPRVLDESGKDLVTFDIKTGESSENESANEIIEREDSYMAVALLADMFITSKQASISGSLTQTKLEIFIGFVSMLLDIIVDELNIKLIPILANANGWDIEKMPTFEATRLNKLNATNLTVFLQSIGKTGLLTPTKDTENSIRKLIFGNSMPEISDAEFDRGLAFNEINHINNVDLPNADDKLITNPDDIKVNELNEAN